MKLAQTPVSPQPPDPGLERTQRWMQAFILAGGENEEAIRASEVQAEVPANVALNLVLPSTTLSSLERVGIYRSMYLGRLGEALENDYPAVRNFLGESGFDDLVARYADAHPSRSYTLNRLGDHFPDFISTDSELPKREFVHDLARLEFAVTLVFDAAETPVLGAGEIAQVPAPAWETARLKPIEALRLLAFRYPVSEYLGAVDEENAFPPIRRKDTWVLVYRHNYGLHRLGLTRGGYQLLSAIIAGMPVGEAIGSCGRSLSRNKLFTWFRDWMSAGLFQSVKLS